MGSFQMLRNRLRDLGYPIYSQLLFTHLDEAINGKRELNQSDLSELEELLAGLVSELERAK